MQVDQLWQGETTCGATDDPRGTPSAMPWMLQGTFRGYCYVPGGRGYCYDLATVMVRGTWLPRGHGYC